MSKPKTAAKAYFVTRPPLDAVQVRFPETTVKTDLGDGMTTETKSRPAPLTILETRTEATPAQAKLLRAHRRYGKDFVETGDPSVAEAAAETITDGDAADGLAVEAEHAEAEAQAALLAAADKAERARALRDAAAEADAAKATEAAVAQAEQEAADADEDAEEASVSADKGGAGHRYDDITTIAAAANVLHTTHGVEMSEMQGSGDRLTKKAVLAAASKVGAVFSSL